MHGGLAAAGAAAEARISHIKGAERKKRILGAAGGAIVSEIVSESMMSSAMRRMETQLLASGHAPNSKAYTDLRQSLLKDEFLKIKTVAQLAVVATAESMKFDLNSAMFAANNALENNSAQVFLQLFAFKEAEDAAQEEEERGRSRERESRRSVSRDQSPERDQDTTFERSKRSVKDGIGSMYAARDRFHQGEFSDATIGGMIGAYGLDAAGQIATGLDRLTFGSISYINKGISQAGDLAATGIRRSVRYATGDARLAQEAGDYATFAAGLFLPGTAAKAAKLEQVAAGIAAASSSSIAALDLSTVARVIAPIHKNSLSYVGKTHLYVIRDSSGKILKYGESAAGTNSLGQSIRGQAQVKRLIRQNPGGDYTSQIVKEFGSKLDARMSEAAYIKTHRKVFGQDSLSLNKNNR